MNWFWDLINNTYIITAVGSWLVAQVFKVVIYAIVNRNHYRKSQISDAKRRQRVAEAKRRSKRRTARWR